MLSDLNNKNVLIVGLGRSGVAAAKYCALQGAKVTVSDKKTATEVKGYIEELSGLPISFSLGKNNPDLMTASDLIVVSPGIPLNIDGLKKACELKIPIKSELELAVNEISAPIIAITGTNGKTTTTALTGHLLSHCGFRVCVGGNIGTPLLALSDEAKNADYVIVEVSSFQLELTPSLSPKVSVLLNITPDHLDRHQSFEEYRDLKLRIFSNISSGSFGLYNADDNSISVQDGFRFLPFSAVSALNNGGWYENGYLNIRLPNSEIEKYSLEDVKLVGAHNYENMLAAVMASRLCGGHVNLIQEGLKTFKGLPHRVELVGEYQGVSYYNDSKGTNVGATVAALGNFDRPVILIAGGLDKGASYQPLVEPIKKNVKKMILVGEAKEKIKRELGHLTNTVFASTIEEGVELAKAEAKSGDVVLLSPACASYDMFRDYKQRGEVFVRAVNNLNAR